jgi:hypothetical protein
MSGDLGVALVESIFPFAVGTLVTLWAYRIIGKKRGADPKLDQWHEDWGRMVRVLGPAIFIYGVVMAVLKYLNMR